MVDAKGRPAFLVDKMVGRGDILLMPARICAAIHALARLEQEMRR
jgi:hypothetical protein